MIRLAVVSALALLVPGLLLVTIACLILRGRRAALPTAAELRRRRLGTTLARDLEGGSVERVTETREPAPPLGRSPEFQRAARDLARANWDDACREARAWVYSAESVSLPSSHPFGWSLVFVGGLLCAVPPTGPAAHRYDPDRCSWEPCSETLATCARRALGWES